MYKITPADIMKVAKTYFTKSNRTVGTLVKKEDVAPAGDDAEDNE